MMKFEKGKKPTATHASVSVKFPGHLLIGSQIFPSNGHDLKRINVQRYFLWWTILPALKPISRPGLESRLKLSLVLASISLQFLGLAKYFILLVVGSDPFWIYWLGDITVNFGHAKDYCDLCFMIWAASTITAQATFTHSYLAANLSWASVFQLIDSHPPRQFGSTLKKIIFRHIHPKMKLICQISLYLLLTTITGILMTSLTYLQQGWLYFFTVGMVYSLLSLANCYITTVFVGLVSIIFSLVCHQYTLWARMIGLCTNNHLLLLNSSSSLPDSQASLNRNFYTFVVKEYGRFHQDLLHSTRFWNRSISGLFLGCSASSVLVVYEYFFVSLDYLTTIAITIFGLCTFIIGCLVNVLAPARFLHAFKQLIKPFHSLIRHELPAGMKIGLIVILEDINENQGFTCINMFQYKYSLLLWTLLELSTFMLLLISSKNGTNTAYSPINLVEYLNHTMIT